ncbi:ribosome maturation factor RimP [Pseudofrankia asymbiotica]|uniref:ribosome maturation factor RimP n=1 Tax=Pseudofrankia asymbiotica TaxID=1834516 RepID=UPI0009767FB0|nr:ribosome maturation factor RimP [Pseudofrankia asymbiotica]
MARDAGRTGRRPPSGSARPGKAAYTDAGAGQEGPGQPAAARPARTAGKGKAAAADSTAALRAAVSERLAPALAEAGFDLEDLNLSRAGSRSVLRVAVDRDGGVDLDAVADASRLISDLLDRVADEAGLLGAYVLEVTSPGVDRPLTQPRHWLRARGRLVEASRVDGTVVVGRVLGADGDGADLAVATGPARRGRPVRTRLERLLFADVARAVVQIEFGHADAPGSAGTGGSGTGEERPEGDDGARANGDIDDRDDELGGDDELGEDEGPDENEDLADADDVWDDEDEDLDDEDLDEDGGNHEGGGDDGLRGLEQDAPAAGGPASGNDLGRARRGRAGGGHEDSGPSPGEETDR